MGLDLWQFDEKALKRSTRELPNVILKEQAEILSYKTGGVIYGKVTNLKFCPQDKNVKYNLASVFEIVVPLLDNYSYTLLVIYSKPEQDYPVAITVGSNPVDDAERFAPRYECQGMEEFVQAMKEILASDEVNRRISTLYAKAGF